MELLSGGTVSWQLMKTNRVLESPRTDFEDFGIKKLVRNRLELFGAPEWVPIHPASLVAEMSKSRKAEKAPQQPAAGGSAGKGKTGQKGKTASSSRPAQQDDGIEMAPLRPAAGKQPVQKTKSQDAGRAPRNCTPADKPAKDRNPKDGPSKVPSPKEGPAKAGPSKDRTPKEAPPKGRPPKSQPGNDGSSGARPQGGQATIRYDGDGGDDSREAGSCTGCEIL